MPLLKRIKWLLISMILVIFTACGGGDTESSNEVITTTAEDYGEGVIANKLQAADPLYTIYEDAEDSSIERWRISDDNPSGATIQNVYDTNKSSQVIELSGDGVNNGFMLGYWSGSKAWNNHHDTVLEWSMNYAETFKIYVRIETKNGNRYIRYSDSNESTGLSGSRIYIGLGEETSNGTWQDFSRDIAVDLKTYESDNELISINGFIIHGSGRVDDIKILKSSKEIYEDAEDTLTTGWTVSDATPEGATIANVYDTDKESRVIELKGSKKQNRYALGERNTESSWENTEYETLKWSMNYAENFSIEISTETTKGHRRLIYTPVDEDAGLNNSVIQLGLGTFSKNGTWQTFVRDLALDITTHESNNTLIQVNSFSIRGSGKIDDIQMLKREKNSYSDGENSTEWRIYDNNPVDANIASLYDSDKESNVIEFTGDGINNGYVLGYWSGSSRAWHNRENSILQWSMKYNEDFRIKIALDTEKGSRYLEYRPIDINYGLNGSTISYGVGVHAINNTWQTFTRDLEADLKAYESNNSIIAVNGFFLKGSGRIDDVEMMHFSPLLANNIAPTISMKGDNPTRLLVGESYEEAGLVVSDDRDTNINVSIDSNVDTSIAGNYEITYTATDSVSNISSTTREVIVFAEDTTPPGIELLGGNPMSIRKNRNYIEDGAILSDNIDDNVELVIEGSVDTSVIGDYVLTYRATDRFGNSSQTIRKVTVTAKNDPKYNLEYEGLTFYQQNLPASSYQLKQLSNNDFNALTDENKLIVADKLLSTLFFAYPANELDSKIEAGNFINEVQNGLEEEQTDKVALEEYILDEEKFYQSTSQEPMVKILSRFSAMKNLDSYLFDNWVAYTLTQTIMFSPAYELETSEVPNVARVYNGLVKALENDEGMRFITFQHMMSEDNWRRFRSPEDNGREMLEIFTLDADDSHVPLAAKALQNWRLDPESNTLVVELNENIEPIELFGTTLFAGVDFYQELVKSDAFIFGATKRLVDHFFFNSDTALRTQITNAIVSSNPESWEDILKQIVFSEEYLLRNNRAKKAEETFFSLDKKLDYQHFYQTAYNFRSNLELMHQATMKYKLGKLDPVPLDTLSFANYHKYIRETILTRKANLTYIDDYQNWSKQGWSPNFVSFDKFDYNQETPIESINSLINLIFKSTVARIATDKELELFHGLIIQDDKSPWQFNMFVQYEDADKQLEKREEKKNYITRIVLEYISRLEETYKFKEVK
ncbi:MAG: Unknown protein [uncultured Sulfurovum sp.]|uniref:DUF5011 domain-containing protein n=1 Tax=uncultured Sulfurovum sp. TaxID=269237 RepID=A0A6S6UF13_9BACT|nr:MAG: Unknown protein [uncultured Sulfurovum sp.]